MHKKNKINRIHMDRMENQKIICQKVLGDAANLLI